VVVEFERIVDIQEIMDAIPFLSALAAVMIVAVLINYGKSVFWLEPEQNDPIHQEEILVIEEE
jgi:hypothetical protein